MKKLCMYIGIGLLVAVAGVLLADMAASFFNGLDYGSACTLAMGMYLCVVIVTCTGLILSKICSKNDIHTDE